MSETPNPDDEVMTVRDLIAALSLASGSLDAQVRCTVKSGNNFVTFGVVSVKDVSTHDSGPFVNLHIDHAQAWDAETYAELPTGVLTIE